MTLHRLTIASKILQRNSAKRQSLQSRIAWLEHQCSHACELSSGFQDMISATLRLTDPHFIQAHGSLIARSRCSVFNLLIMTTEAQCGCVEVFLTYATASSAERCETEEHAGSTAPEQDGDSVAFPTSDLDLMLSMFKSKPMKSINCQQTVNVT